MVLLPQQTQGHLLASAQLPVHCCVVQHHPCSRSCSDEARRVGAARASNPSITPADSPHEEADSTYERLQSWGSLSASPIAFATMPPYVARTPSRECLLPRLAAAQPPGFDQISPLIKIGGQSASERASGVRERANRSVDSRSIRPIILSRVAASPCTSNRWLRHLEDVSCLAQLRWVATLGPGHFKA